jgi:peptidase E
MTTYILHGGEASANSSSNAAFWTLMASHVAPGGTWLGCYFARNEGNSDEKFQRDALKIQSAAVQPISCFMATLEDFESQIKSADVIYFAGGSTLDLLASVHNWPELGSWLQNAKVVAGCSAGMNLLGRRFITKKGESGEGLGLVPFNLLVHHRAPHYREVHEANPLPHPTLAMHEEQFCVLESKNLRKPHA